MSRPGLLILAPPRTGSTALARCFWQHPDFGWYVHEPFDRVFHHGAPERDAEETLAAPERVSDSATGGTVIKEMTFQVTVPAQLDVLLEHANLPVLIPLRDPRLAIWSRMKQLAESQQGMEFGRAQAGWRPLLDAIRHLQDREFPHVLIDMHAVREDPERGLARACRQLGITAHAMGQWASTSVDAVGQLGDEQAAWYRQALTADQLLPDTADPPDIHAFPPSMRSTVEEGVAIYEAMTSHRHDLERT